MKKIIALCLLLLVWAPALAVETIYLQKANSEAVWLAPYYGPSTTEAPSGVSYTTAKCGSGILIEDSTDYAIIESKGTFGTVSGGRTNSWTLQFWYKSTGSPGAYCRFFGMETKAVPVFRKYGDNTTLRWDDTSICQFSSVKSVFDGSWHLIKLTAQDQDSTAASNRKIYIDGTLAGTCTDSIYGWGGTALADADDMVFGNSPDKDNPCFGYYDEIQMSNIYDDTIPDYVSGASCSGESYGSTPTPTANAGSFIGSTFTTADGCTSDCPQDYQVYSSQSTGGTLLASGSAAELDETNVWYTTPYGFSTSHPVSLRTRCYRWLPLSEECVSSELESWSSWVTLNAGPLRNDPDSTTQRGRATGGDNFERIDTLNTVNGVDPGAKVWHDCAAGIGGKYWRILSRTLKSGGTDVQFYCNSYRLRHRDQWVQFFYYCPSSCTLSNTDLAVHLRHGSGPNADYSASNISYYSMKAEGGNFQFQKLADKDGDGVLDTGEYAGACGVTSAFTQSDVQSGFWIRIEVYDDPTTSGQVILKGYKATNTGGSTGVAGYPGSWTLVKTITDDTAGTDCSAWAMTGGTYRYPQWDNGMVQVSIQKNADQRIDKISWGLLETNPVGRGVQYSHKRVP